MARLSEKEIEEIRRQHGIKPEHIGKQGKYTPPRTTREASQPPVDLLALIRK